MPKRSYTSISNLFAKLNLTNKKEYWTEQQTVQLRELWPVYGKKSAQYIEGKTEQQCCDKAKRLKLKCEASPFNKKITSEEKEIFIKYYETEGGKIINRLSGFTPSRVQSVVTRLGLTYKGDYNKKWTEEMDKFLQECYSTKGANYCSQHLGRSANACICRARKLNLQVTKVARYAQKPIICIETGEIFTSIPVAKKQYPKCDIHGCINKKQSVSQGLHWSFVDDQNYIQELQSMKGKSYTTNKAKPVLCVETGEIFRSAIEAKEKYGGNPDACARGMQNTASGYHWRYINE